MYSLSANNSVRTALKATFFVSSVVVTFSNVCLKVMLRNMAQTVDY